MMPWFFFTFPFHNTSNKNDSNNPEIQNNGVNKLFLVKYKLSYITVNSNILYPWDLVKKGRCNLLFTSVLLLMKINVGDLINLRGDLTNISILFKISQNVFKKKV